MSKYELTDPLKYGLSPTRRNRRVIDALKERLHADVYSDSGETDISPLLEAVRRIDRLDIREIELASPNPPQEIMQQVGITLDPKGFYDVRRLEQERPVVVARHYDTLFERTPPLAQTELDNIGQLLCLTAKNSRGMILTIRGPEFTMDLLKKGWDSYLGEFSDTFGPVSMINANPEY